LIQGSESVVRPLTRRPGGNAAPPPARSRAKARNSMRLSSAQFNVGQIVRHLRFGYRGVIFDIDPVFTESDDWYEAMALSRPPKDRPWYRVLVDGERHTTYVAERHLVDDDETAEISHPMIDELFGAFESGRYRPRLPNS